MIYDLDFRPCQRLLDCLPALQHDRNRPEDVLKVDAHEEGIGADDAADALRYLCDEGADGGASEVEGVVINKSARNLDIRRFLWDRRERHT